MISGDNSKPYQKPYSWVPHILLVGLAILVTGIVLEDTYLEIFNFWWNYSSYNHCLLIVPISLFLIYEKRDELKIQLPALSILGFIFFLVNIALWLISNLLYVSALQHIAAVGLIIGIVWTLSGNSIAKFIAFPLFYLYFGVPEGEVLVPYLRDLTAEVVVHLLRLTNIPVYLEGRHITIPSGQFHVAKACSGINYLIATLAVGTVFAYLRYQSNLRRLLFMILAISVPLIANGIRAYGIVLIAHYSDYKYAMGVDHYIYGWLFFGLVIFLLFAIGNTFSDVSDEPVEKTPISAAAITAGMNWTSIFLALIMITTVFASREASERMFDTAGLTANYALAGSDAWEQIDRVTPTIEGIYSGSPIVLSGRFSDGPERFVDLEAAIYQDRKTNGEVESRTNYVAQEEIWRLISGPEKYEIEDLSAKVNEYTFRRGADTYLLWRWYDVNGRSTIDSGKVKWEVIEAQIRGNYVGSAIIAVSTSFLNDVDVARQVLRDFVKAVDPSTVRFLRKIPD